MEQIAVLVMVGAVLFALYTYAGYPLLLIVLARVLRSRPHLEDPSGTDSWPMVSISLPVYNEEHQVADTIDSLLALDYPPDRLQIVVVSDASTDRTDEIVRSYAGRGVELVRQPRRLGKTAGELATAGLLRGSIVVNTDASIRIPAGSLKKLVAPLRDPEIGLASGRDVSVGRQDGDANRGEGRYVGYEMWIRDLETRTGGIVGASGCFYAIRRSLHGAELPDHLSRDFAAALFVREQGLRAVSVPEATCLVPRAGSLAGEYRRKVRTISRGMQTLRHKAHLLHPFDHGLFSWKLFSHKVARWMVPWLLLAGFMAGLLILLATSPPVGLLSLAVLVGLVLLTAGTGLDGIPHVLSLPAYALLGNLSILHATIRVIAGARDSSWEPTRRERSPLGPVDPGPQFDGLPRQEQGARLRP